MPSTNEVFGENENKIFAGLRTERDEESDWVGQYVLIEGDADAFRFLGKLFTAMADMQENCSNSFHPAGAGSAHFIDGSNLGFMLHRNDCAHGSKR
jgi:hypothetical protein